MEIYSRVHGLQVGGIDEVTAHEVAEIFTAGEDMPLGGDGSGRGRRGRWFRRGLTEGLGLGLELREFDFLLFQLRG